jgi:hypothetical protein
MGITRRMTKWHKTARTTDIPRYKTARLALGITPVPSAYIAIIPTRLHYLVDR